MTLQECAQAFRVSNVLRKMEVYDEFDNWIGDKDNYDEKEIRPQKQTQNKGIEDDEYENEKEDLTGFNDKQAANLIDIIRSDNSTSQHSSMTSHSTKTKRFNKKTSLSKGYQITYFINTMYKNCKHHGIEPTILIDWIVDLFNFYSILSETPVKQSNIYNDYQKNAPNENIFPKEELMTDDKTNSKIPLISRVSFYIEQRKSEILQLVNKKKTIMEEINRQSEQKNKVQTDLSNKIDEKKEVFSYFQWYSTLKQELRNKFNIAIEIEFELFARLINDFRDYDHNALRIIAEYRDILSLREQRSLLKTEMDANNQTRQHLINDINQLKDQAYSYRQTVKTFHQLQQIGFGLPRLKELNGLITEISAANSIDPSEAVTIFFKELEKTYDSKLGLESKIKGMQDEYELLKNKVAENQRYLAMQNPVAPNLVYLYSQGLNNDDIKGFTDLVLSLSNSYLLDYKSFKKDNTIYPSTFNNSNSNNIIDKKEFWKLIVQKFKDLNIINSQIERLRYHRKLEEMKQPYDQDDDLAS